MIVRCPACGEETPYEENPFRPFCSERCKLLDLGKWAAEDYRVPVETPQDAPEKVPDDTDSES